MRKLRKVMAWVGAVAVVLVAVNFGYKAMLPYWYQKGIDVSHHNGRIEWEKVDTDIQFAYIKVSEGGNFVDKEYERNRDGARRNGIKVGGYHFFRENVSGEVQYRNFISHVGETELIPAVDIEDVTFSDEMMPNLKGAVPAARGALRRQADHLRRSGCLHPVLRLPERLPLVDKCQIRQSGVLQAVLYRLAIFRDDPS